ncbi:hypothetical protein DFH07DRAFT_764588 [Mycena maculata]|uniref:Uncharacterized protein n=1 Tax=Mycena maculata TaxID=230809 RepID=A0AAD7KBJ5_9AGAR|nr:hypothetical protein DFH07DRAFT_764588 [Mycena maculata]
MITAMRRQHTRPEMLPNENVTCDIRRNEEDCDTPGKKMAWELTLHRTKERHEENVGGGSYSVLCFWFGSGRHRKGGIPATNKLAEVTEPDGVPVGVYYGTRGWVRESVEAEDGRGSMSGVHMEGV